MLYWIVVGIVFLALVAAYIVVFLYARKRQKAFDAQYRAAKERHEVFVLNKKIVKERPETRWGRWMKIKTYQVVGRVSVSQAVRGIQMSRMQTVPFRTTKAEYDKIQVNHKYKMDIAGNYIGYVVAPPPVKEKTKGMGRRNSDGAAKDRAGSERKAARADGKAAPSGSKASGSNKKK